MVHLAYGVPRVHAELQCHGRTVNHKRLERLMREHSMSGVTRRRRRSLTRPDRQARPAPDLTARDFTAARPGIRLVGDITYPPTGEGGLYLAYRLDLATREIVGWSVSDNHRADPVVNALHMAHGRGHLKPGCIAHGGSGSEYTSTQLRAKERQLGVRMSTGRIGSCYDCQSSRTGSRKDRVAPAEAV